MKRFTDKMRVALDRVDELVSKPRPLIYENQLKFKFLGRLVRLKFSGNVCKDDQEVDNQSLPENNSLSQAASADGSPAH